MRSVTGAAAESGSGGAARALVAVADKVPVGAAAEVVGRGVAGPVAGEAKEVPAVAAEGSMVGTGWYAINVVGGSGVGDRGGTRSAPSCCARVRCSTSMERRGANSHAARDWAAAVVSSATSARMRCIRTSCAASVAVAAAKALRFRSDAAVAAATLACSSWQVRESSSSRLSSRRRPA